MNGRGQCRRRKMGLTSRDDFEEEKGDVVSYVSCAENNRKGGVRTLF